MKELDLTLAGVANQNSKQGKKIINEQARIEAMEDVNRTLTTIDQAKREKAIRNFCENSIQDKNNSKRKQVHGKTYVGKNYADTIKIGIATVAAIGVSVAAAKFGIHGLTQVVPEISEYNRVLNQKIENELTSSEQLLYQEENKNPISNMIDAYQQIQEAKEELNPEHYNFLGDNLQDGSSTYLPFDKGSLFSLSEKQQDAIDVATDQVIEEYQGRGK